MKKRFFLITLVVIILASAGILLAIYALTPSSVDSPRITNISSNGFTVVWNTPESLTGKVWVTQNESLSPGDYFNGAIQYFDDRDTEQTDEGFSLKDGGQQRRTSHHVTVTGLDPESTYYIWVGGVWPSVLTQTGNQATTAAVSEGISVPDPMYAKVLDQYMQPLEDAIITVTLEERTDTDIASSPQSTFTNDEGGWQVDVTNFVTSEGDRFQASEDTRIVVSVEKDGNAYTNLYSYEEYKPLDSIIFDTSLELNPDEIDEQAYLESGSFTPNAVSAYSAQVLNSGTYQEFETSNVLGEVLSASSCRCKYGKYADGTSIPESSSYAKCGTSLRVCGGGNKYYQCGSSGQWINLGTSCSIGGSQSGGGSNQGGSGGSSSGGSSICRCKNGVDKNGNPVSEYSSYAKCGTSLTICGADYHNYRCSAGGSWIKLSSCGSAPTPSPTPSPTRPPNTGGNQGGGTCTCSNGVRADGTPISTSESVARCGTSLTVCGQNNVSYRCGTNARWQVAGSCSSSTPAPTPQASRVPTPKPSVTPTSVKITPTASTCTGTDWDDNSVTVNLGQYVCGRDQWYRCNKSGSTVGWTAEGHVYSNKICENGQEPVSTGGGSTCRGTNFRGDSTTTAHNGVVCGLDQWYQCKNGSYTPLGIDYNNQRCSGKTAPRPIPTYTPTPTPGDDTGPQDCRCTAGARIDGSAVDANSTYCGMQICGKGHAQSAGFGQVYSCTSTGWVNQNTLCSGNNDDGPTGQITGAGLQNCPTIPSCTAQRVEENRCFYQHTSGININGSVALTQSGSSYIPNYSDYSRISSICSSVSDAFKANVCTGQCYGDAANTEYDSQTTCFGSNHSSCHKCECPDGNCNWTTISKFQGCLSNPADTCDNEGGIWNSSLNRCVPRGATVFTCVSKTDSNKTIVVGVSQACPSGYRDSDVVVSPSEAVPPGCCSNSNQCDYDQTCEPSGGVGVCGRAGFNTCIDVPSGPEEGAGPEEGESGDNPDTIQIPSGSLPATTCTPFENGYQIHGRYNPLTSGNSNHPGLDISGDRWAVYAPATMEIVFRQNNNTYNDRWTGTISPYYGKVVVGRGVNDDGYYLLAHLAHSARSLAPGTARSTFQACDENYSNAPCANENNNVVLPACSFIGTMGNTSSQPIGIHVHLEHITACPMDEDNRYYTPECFSNPESTVLNNAPNPRPWENYTSYGDPYSDDLTYVPSALDNTAQNVPIAQALPGNDVLAASTDSDGTVTLEKGVYSISAGSTRISDYFVRDNTVTVQFYDDLNGDLKRQDNEPFITSEEISAEISKTAELETYNFIEGWNLVAFDLISENWNSASELLDELNEQDVYATHVFQFVDNKWYSFSQRKDSIGNNLTFGEDFPIVPGRGYFVKALNTTSVTLSGNRVTSSLALKVNRGWNLVGITSDTPYTAQGLLEICNSQSSLECQVLSRYESGRYDNLIYDAGMYFGNDFNLLTTKGYFLKIESGEGQFTP